MADKTARIPVDLIDVDDQKHRLKTDVTGLVESIQKTGQINPIVVRKKGRRFVVKAGRRRLSALQTIQAMTGQKQMAFVVIRKGTESEATKAEHLADELIKIDENIMRQELDDIEFDEALFRRKEIYEELHPETKQHVAGGTAKGRDAGEKSARAFTKDAADKLNVSKRTIEKAVARAGKASAMVKRARAEGRLSQSKVDYLVGLKPEEQDMLLPFVETMDVKGVKALIEKTKKRDVKAMKYEMEEEAMGDQPETREMKAVVRDTLKLNELVSAALKSRATFRSKARFDYVRALEQLAATITKFTDFQRAALGETRAIRRRAGETKVIRRHA